MKPIEVIYEDEDIIAVNKPSGMLAIPDRFDSTIDSLLTRLRKKHDHIYTVHRLDRETSGVILFAKSAEIHKALSTLFQEHNIEKIYWALSICPSDMEGNITNRIAENKAKLGTYSVQSKGRLAITDYKVLNKLGRYALIEVNIKTGRTHQIRVHLKHINAQLMADRFYGISDQFFLSEIKKYRKNRLEDERPLLSRSSLHARRISFIHPTLNKSITIEADLQKDMKATLNQLLKTFK